MITMQLQSKWYVLEAMKVRQWDTLKRSVNEHTIPQRSVSGLDLVASCDKLAQNHPSNLHRHHRLKVAYPSSRWQAEWWGRKAGVVTRLR